MADEKGKPPTPPTSGPSGDDAPPPTPAGGPPPPPPKPSSSGTGGGKSNNTVMLILSYLWLLALIPYITEKEDAEVQWHAKHGLVLCVAEFILWIVLFILQFIPILGCLLYIVAFFGVCVIHVMAIVKATKGERLMIPYVSEYTEKF